MEDQQRYWNERCAAKTFTSTFMLDAFRQHVPADAAILDFGCGYGRTLAELRDAGYTRLTGIDFADALIQRGRRENPGLDLAAYPGGPLPYPDNTFDAALMLGVMTCMPETRTQAETLIELRRVLRPGSILYVNDFLLNRDKRNLDRYRDGKKRHGIYGIFDSGDGGILRHHDRNHMEALFFDFETVLFEEVTYPTMHGHESAGFYAVLRMPA